MLENKSILKPCPFCGGRASYISITKPDQYPHCNACGAEANSAEEWNIRGATDFEVKARAFLKALSCKIYSDFPDIQKEIAAFLAKNP